MQLSLGRIRGRGWAVLWVAWASAQPAGAQAPAPAKAPAAAQALAPAQAPAPAQAQSHVPPPTLSAWMDEAKGASGAYPQRLAFLTALPEKGGTEPPKFLALDGAAFNRFGYFQVVDQPSAAWDFKLNSAALSELDPLTAMIQLTHADTVVIAPEKGDWQLLRPGSGDQRAVVLKAKAPKSKSPEAISNWLIQSLGWDGVVIEQKGEYLLVGSTAATLATPEIQALAVGDSATKLVLAKAERRGAGLLSLSESKGGYGIFDIVLLDQGTTKLAPGTKLLIEKKK